VEQLKDGEKPISPRVVAGAEEIKMTVLVEGESDYSAVEGSLEVEVTSTSINYAQNNLRGAALKEFKDIGHFKYLCIDLDSTSTASKILRTSRWPTGLGVICTIPSKSPGTRTTMAKRTSLFTAFLTLLRSQTLR